MENLYILIAFLGLGLVTLVLMEWRERKRKKAQTDNPQADKMIRVPVDDACCGRHLVCERESLLTTKPEIIYYDDEELDRLSGLDCDNGDNGTPAALNSDSATGLAFINLAQAVVTVVNRRNREQPQTKIVGTK